MTRSVLGGAVRKVREAGRKANERGGGQNAAVRQSVIGEAGVGEEILNLKCPTHSLADLRDFRSAVESTLRSLENWSVDIDGSGWMGHELQRWSEVLWEVGKDKRKCVGRR